MRYVRVKSYLNGEFTGAEHAYYEDSTSRAIERFRKAYPEHKDCIVIAEPFDSEDPKYKDWLKAAEECGCVHVWD